MGLMSPLPAVANFVLHPELILYAPIIVVSYIFTDWVVRKVTKSSGNQGGDDEEAALVS